MKEIIKRMILKFIIWYLRKYRRNEISFLTNSNGRFIYWNWRWSDEFEKDTRFGTYKFDFMEI